MKPLSRGPARLFFLVAVVFSLFLTMSYYRSNYGPLSPAERTTGQGVTVAHQDSLGSSHLDNSLASGDVVMDKLGNETAKYVRTIEMEARFLNSRDCITLTWSLTGLNWVMQHGNFYTRW